MTLTCVGRRLEEAGAWSQGCFRADSLVEGNKDPRVYWRVSLALPNLWALCLHNEICPDQRQIMGAEEDVCRFNVMDGLLKRTVPFLHVCSCAMLAERIVIAQRLTVQTIYNFMVSVFEVRGVEDEGFSYKNNSD